MLATSVPVRSITAVRSEWFISPSSGKYSTPNSAHTLAYVGDRPGEEMPSLRIGFPLRRVCGQRLRRVALRVERDRQQHDILAQLFRESLLQDAEVVRDPQAELRQRAARVDEVHDDHFAGQTREPNGLSRVIDQREVRHARADLERLRRHGPPSSA